MEQYKSEFIQFMVDSKVLKFGEFTLKSGRKSPFFMNAGGYVTGSQLKKLGEYYAKAIHDKYGDDFDVLFGPAYKGIPLAVVTAMAYSELFGKEVLDADIQIVGKVSDVIFDTDSYEITDLVLKKKGFSEQIKASEDLVPIELVKVIGDKILLKGEDDL